MFSALDIILGARGVLKNGHLLNFDVSQGGCLERTKRENEILQWAFPKRIGVVIRENSQWDIDPNPKNFKPEWVVWVYGKWRLQ